MPRMATTNDRTDDEIITCLLMNKAHVCVPGWLDKTAVASTSP